MRRLFLVAIVVAMLSGPPAIRAGGFLVWDELSWTQDLVNAIKDYAQQINQYVTALRQLENELLESTGINDIARIRSEIQGLRQQAYGTYYQVMSLTSASGAYAHLIDPHYWENYRPPYSPGELRDHVAPIVDQSTLSDLEALYGPDQRAYQREKEMLEWRAQMRDQARQRMQEIEDIADRALGDPDQTEKQALQVGNAQNQLLLDQGEQMQATLDAILSTQRETERRDMEARRIALDEIERKRRATAAAVLTNYWEGKR